MLPYGRHLVDDNDVAAVTTVLRGSWLTTGPTVDDLEAEIARRLAGAHVVAVSSGTAALHAACSTLDLAPGDEVIMPALTFVATANAVLYCGGRPVFAEISDRTFVLDATDIEHRITARTRAIAVVHYAGLATDLKPFEALAQRHGLVIVEDAAHALGAVRDGRPVGSGSEIATFSFHPVKHVTTGEGGAVATSSAERAARMRRFRNHGISTDIRSRERAGTWVTDMVDLGFNYRLSDIGAALGLSQLSRIDQILERRRALARRYMAAFAGLEVLRVQEVADIDGHAWHIFPIALELERLRIDRDGFIRALRSENIGATFHYGPVHLQPYYRERFGTRIGDLPATEDLAARLVTLPLFPGMTDADQDDVLEAVRRLAQWFRR